MDKVKLKAFIIIPLAPILFWLWITLTAPLAVISGIYFVIGCAFFKRTNSSGMVSLPTSVMAAGDIYEEILTGLNWIKK